jgi:putative peptidoglycan lipid II flippase
MLLVFAPQVVLYGIGVVFVGALQAHRRFLGPALAPLLSSLVVMAAYLTFAAVANRHETTLTALPLSHELVLSVGTTLGVAALALPLTVLLHRKGRRLTPSLRFPPGAAATVRRMAVAGAVVVGSQDLATGAILRLANDRGAGGAVVLYNLAWTVFLVPWAVLAVPIATTAFPTLSAAWESADVERYARTVATTTRAVVLTTAAASAVLVAAAGPLARVVVLGAPGGVEPRVLSRALVAFAPGLIGYALVTHLSRAHYARGDARTPAMATATGWVVAIAADLVLVSAFPREWTATALGAGTSIGMTVAAAWQVARLAARGGTTTLRGLAATTGAAVVAGASGALGGYAVSRALPAGGVAVSAAFAVAVALTSLAVYAALVAVLDRPTLLAVLRRRYAGA